MRQYNEAVEIFKNHLAKEQEKLRVYQRGELRTMTLEAGRWCDSTVIDIEQTKQRIRELTVVITHYETAGATAFVRRRKAG
jgi:hypothetical protein